MQNDPFDKYMGIFLSTAVVVIGIISCYSMRNSHVEKLVTLEAAKTINANKDELNKRLEVLEKLIAKHDKDLKELNAVFNAGD